MEDIEITLADHMNRVLQASFNTAWEELSPENELSDTYALTHLGSLEEAVRNVTNFLGMQPAERSDKVPEGKSSHSLYLAGKASSIYYSLGISLTSELIYVGFHYT